MIIRIPINHSFERENQRQLEFIYVSLFKGEKTINKVYCESWHDFYQLLDYWNKSSLDYKFYSK